MKTSLFTRRSLVSWGPVGVFLAIGLGVYGWFEFYTGRNFVYWTAPNPFHERERLSIGAGHGQLFFAYGWPYVGERSDGRPLVEPLTGGDSRADRLREARTRFGMMIDSTPEPHDYPRCRIPIWVVALGMVVAVALSFTTSRRFGGGTRDQGAK